MANGPLVFAVTGSKPRAGAPFLIGLRMQSQ
jgi:hypothetical protein